MTTTTGTLAFSYCETVTAGPRTPWHIRMRYAAEPLRPGGGIYDHTLCGRGLSGGWDIAESGYSARQVTERDLGRLGDAVCAVCAEKFRRTPPLVVNRRRDALLALAFEHGYSPVPSANTADCWSIRLDGYRLLTVYGEANHACLVTLLDDWTGENRDITQRDARLLIETARDKDRATTGAAS